MTDVFVLFCCLSYLPNHISCQIEPHTPIFPKQIARAKQVKSHFVQKELQESHDSRKAAEKAATGVIVSLGLVEEEGK